MAFFIQLSTGKLLCVSLALHKIDHISWPMKWIFSTFVHINCRHRGLSDDTHYVCIPTISVHLDPACDLGKNSPPDTPNAQST